jgi:hypothetical protein
MENKRVTIPKRELHRIISRFLRDKDRGISVELFSDLCGLSAAHIRDVFLHDTEPMTEYVQRRVSKAYTEWKDGQIAIMQNRDNTKFYEYRKEARPALKKESKLQLVNGQFTIKMGIANRYDYFDQTLDEQLERG